MEPNPDKLDAEFDGNPNPDATEPGKGFSLASLKQIDWKDPAKKRKLGVGLFVLVAALVFGNIFAVRQAPSPARPAQMERANVAGVSPSVLKETAERVQQQVPFAWSQIKDTATGATDAGQAQPLTPEQQAQLARLNAQQAQMAYQGPYGGAPAETHQDTAREKQEAALHASNMALAADQQQAGENKTPAVPDPYTWAAAAQTAQQNATGAAQANVAENEDHPSPKSDEANQPRATREKQDDNSYAAYTGKLYRLPEDTVLEGVLVNKLNNSFAGPVIAQLSTNVWSHDGQQLLIPAGTRIVGEVKRVEALGDQRLALTFHRMIMPDLYPVSLDQFQGLNQIGETGLRDKVNHHYLQIFGVSLALGAIAGLSQIGTNYGGYAVSAGTQYRAGISQSLSESAMRILDRYTNILPTFTVREGTRVRVILTDDLLVPAYFNHRLPSEL